MKLTNRYLLVILLAVPLCLMTSCKKVAREVVQEAVEKGTSKSVSKSVAREMEGKGVEKLTQREIASFGWEDLYKAIAKKYPSLAKSFTTLDGATQAALKQSLQKDYRFFRAFTSSNNALDACKDFTKNTPKLMKDPNFIRMYVKEGVVRNEGRYCFIDDLISESKKGWIRFYNKTNNLLVAEYRDGAVKVTDRSILNHELIPNAFYVVNGANDKKCTFLIDDLGRISSVKAQNMSADEVATVIVNRTGNNDLGRNWENALRKLKQTSKGDDVKVECKFNYSSNDDVLPKYTHVDAEVKGEKQISSSFENARKLTYTEMEGEAKGNLRRVQTINDQLVGKKHPNTGVPYVEKVVFTDGGEKVVGVFPEFGTKFEARLPENLYKATDDVQFAECARQLKLRCETDPEFSKRFTETELKQIVTPEKGGWPYGYTWHHNEETGLMQLVDYETHTATRHTGGRNIWGGGTDYR